MLIAPACLLLSLVLALLVPAVGWARNPSTGVGLFAGIARHVGTVRLTRPQTLEFDYDSKGPLVGLDYVWAPARFFSLGGQFIVTDESSDEFTEKILHGRLAAQIRLWYRQVFLGYQYGLYSLAFTFEDSGTGLKERISGNGPGYGVLAGWEGDSGWFVTAQFDQFEIDAFDGTITENGVTTVSGNTTENGLFVYVGFRWH